MPPPPPLLLPPPLQPPAGDDSELELGLGSGVDFLRIRKWVGYCDKHYQGTYFAIEDVWKRVDPLSYFYFIDV